MKRLDKLQEELYSSSGQVRNVQKDLSKIDPRVAEQERLKEEILRKKELEKGREFTRKQRKFLLKTIIGIFIVLLFLGIGYAIYNYLQSGFQEEDVILSIDSPPEVEVGEKFTFKILYHNNNRVDLYNSQLKITFPDSLVVETVSEDPKDTAKDSMDIYLGDIKKGQNKEIIFEAKITKKLKTIHYVNAVLSYNVKNYKQSFIKKAQNDIQVKEVKLFFQFEATRQAASGNLVEYYVKLKNNSTETLNQVEIRLKYPEDFDFSSSSISAADDKKTVFKLPALLAREEFELIVKGIVKGTSLQSKRAIAQVGIYEEEEFKILGEETAATEIVTSPLIINQFLESEAPLDPGGSVSVELEYFNSSQVAMKDVIITTDLKGRAINYKEVESEKGYYDRNEKRIIWRASQVPELKILEPNEKGSLTFSVPVLAKLPSETEDDKNFEVSIISQIDSPDVPTPIGVNKLISSSQATLKVNSKVIFSVEAVYNDTFIENRGPIPPRVGEETTYTIHWRIINVNNDLKDVVIKSSLPEYIEWKDRVYPINLRSQIAYNPRTKEVTWKAGDVQAFVGTRDDPKEIIFQVALIPKSSHIGKELKLLNESSFYGKDVFTGKDHEIKLEPLSNNIINDPGVAGQYLVVPGREGYKEDEDD
jgi:hypothetical protein